MNVGAKLGLYGLLLVAVLGASAAVGAAVGPVDTKSTAALAPSTATSKSP